jgi:hypothetical protein
MFADDADSAMSEEEEAGGRGGAGVAVLGAAPLAGAAAAERGSTGAAQQGGALVRSDSAIAAAAARRTVASTGVELPFDFLYPRSWLDDEGCGLSEEEEEEEAEEDAAGGRGEGYAAAESLGRRGSGAVTLIVQRATLQADALRLLLDRSAAEAIRKDKFRVVFSGEQGDDEGGLTREFLGVSLAPLPSDWHKAAALFAYDVRPGALVAGAARGDRSGEPRVTMDRWNRARHW